MTTQTRYDLNALFLLVLLGGATAASRGAVDSPRTD
jgi:hypothetical protein